MERAHAATGACLEWGCIHCDSTGNDSREQQAQQLQQCRWAKRSEETGECKAYARDATRFARGGASKASKAQ